MWKFPTSQERNVAGRRAAAYMKNGRISGNANGFLNPEQRKGKDKNGEKIFLSNGKVFGAAVWLLMQPQKKKKKERNTFKEIRKKRQEKSKEISRNRNGEKRIKENEGKTLFFYGFEKKKKIRKSFRSRTFINKFFFFS